MRTNSERLGMVLGLCIGLLTTACSSSSGAPNAPTPAYSSGTGQGVLDAPQGVKGGGNPNNGNNGQGNDGNQGNAGGNGGNDQPSPTPTPQIAGLYNGVVTLGDGNVGCHSPIYFVVELTQNGASVNASITYDSVLLVWHGSIPNNGNVLNLTFSPGLNIPFRCNFTDFLASGATFSGTINGDTISGTGFVALSDNHQEVGGIYATAVLTKQ